MNAFGEGLVTIALMFGALAALSVLVSKNATTASDIQAVGSAFGNNLGVAISPVTGADYSVNLGYPNSGGATLFGG